MNFRTASALVLTIGAYFLLFPGLTLPIMHLSVDGKVRSQIANIDVSIMNKERSILGTAVDLYEQNHLLVAGLIVLFCLIIPILKGLLLLTALSIKNQKRRIVLKRILDAVGKWSMTDVFLVAILLTLLATDEQGSHIKHNLNVMGMNLPVEVGVIIRSQIEAGFWWFLAYCLVSLAGIQVARVK